MPFAGYTINALAAYLLGSIPTGFLVGKARGVDIRTLGSGNIGATNVFRALGRPAGILVLLADALKGWLAVAIVSQGICSALMPGTSHQVREAFALVAGVFAVVGHNYTCWLHFKGGKGIATSAGVLLALVPMSLLVILLVWIVVFALSRYVSLASICAASTLPFATWLLGGTITMILVTSALTVLAVYKHKSNIKRLLTRTESRFGGKKQPPPARPPSQSSQTT